MRQVPLRKLLDFHPVHCTKYHDIVGPTSSTMVAVYDYFPRRHMNNYFLYDRYENVYFLYIVPNAFRPKCTLRRYNSRERPPWTECMC